MPEMTVNCSVGDAERVVRRLFDWVFDAREYMVPFTVVSGLVDATEYIVPSLVVSISVGVAETVAD